MNTGLVKLKEHSSEKFSISKTSRNRLSLLNKVKPNENEFIKEIMYSQEKRGVL
jgi:hypothetical protein